MNRIAPGRSAAVPMLIASLAARIFAEMSLNFADTGCAEWMCPLIGLLMCLPLLLWMQSAALSSKSIFETFAEKVKPFVKGIACFILAALFLTDCAGIVRLIANTANITALITAATPFLVLPVAIVIFAVCRFGSDAVGHSARVWLYVAPVLLLIIFAVQFRRYEPAWLTPIFGTGVRSLIKGGLDCAGMIALFSLIWLISIPDRNRKPLILPVGIACAIAAILLALMQMLSPVQTGLPQTQATRLKLLLSNGRVALILQIVLVIVWYGSLLHVISAQSVAAFTLVQTALPKVNPRMLAAGLAVLIGIAASTEMTAQPWLAALIGYRFPIVGGIILGILIPVYIVNRRDNAQ